MLIFIAMSACSGIADAKGSIEKNGDALQILIPLSGLAASFFEDDNEGTIQFFKSMATSAVVTEVLKESVHKRRPNGSCCQSFPSGHTSAAFMGAAFIHRRYGLKYGIPAYIGATYVGYSRVQADKHYVEDVIAGAAIGVLSSFYFTTSYQGFELSPVAGDGVYGLNISKRW
jgi:membrane-associated phospholipid phosphatase